MYSTTSLKSEKIVVLISCGFFKYFDSLMVFHWKISRFSSPVRDLKGFHYINVTFKMLNVPVSVLVAWGKNQAPNILRTFTFMNDRPMTLSTRRPIRTYPSFIRRSDDHFSYNILNLHWKWKLILDFSSRLRLLPSLLNLHGTKKDTTKRWSPWK